MGSSAGDGEPRRDAGDSLSSAQGGDAERIPPQKKIFTLEHTMEAPVRLYYEVPDQYLNHRVYVKSKDSFVAPTIIPGSGLTCDAAESIEEAKKRRGNYDPVFASYLPASNGGSKFRPCGLVALAMFTDTFKLHKGLDQATEPLNLDESGIALSSDEDIYKDRIKSDAGKITVDGDASWLQAGSFVEHFQVWYRTPPSPLVRNLWANAPSGLPKGTYTLGFPVNSPIWAGKWGAPEKRVVLAEASWAGSKGACFVLGVFCAVSSGIQACMFVVFVVLGFVKRQAHSASQVHPFSP